MKKTFFALALAGVTMFGSGCYHITMTSDASVEPIPAYDRGFKSFFLLGLIGTGDIDVNAICPAGIARYEEQLTVGNFIVTVLTFGLYSPLKTQLWCAVPNATDQF